MPITRHQKYERLLRRLRQRIFTYEDESPERGEKCAKLMRRCKEICQPEWERQARNRDRTNSQEFMFRTS